ncbi:hypothetical protein GCM10018966_019610 [Streptomyces yanii]
MLPVDDDDRDLIALRRTDTRRAVHRLPALSRSRWEAMRADVLAGLSLTEDAGEHLARLMRGLDAAWRQMADRLEEAGDGAKAEVVVPGGGGRARLSVDKLGAVGEPESLTWLKATTEAMLARIDLQDLLFEVHSWTGFLDAFGHVSDRRTRMEDLPGPLPVQHQGQRPRSGPAPLPGPGRHRGRRRRRRLSSSKTDQRLSSSWRCWAAGSFTYVSSRYRSALCLGAAAGEWIVRSQGADARYG